MDSAVDRAERLIRLHDRRAALFPGLFADPAWQAILALFVAAERSTSVAADDLTARTGYSRALTRRWVDVLQSLHLVEADGTHLRMTPHGQAKMRQLLYTD